ncbi:MAG: hypothetical protein IPK84_01620 [Candidatus Moraniibacteriota bacterium]|nr:MAG: hypothetical protein IPK84_01620 [Candidatus Moranbacteria bacterium]
MHPYSTDTAERRFVPLLLSVAAILTAWGFGHLLEILNIAVPWWFDAPSVMGFYAIFYNLFDNYLWRWNLLRFLRLVKTPCISGEWHGTAVSSFNNEQQEVSLRIKQTWTSIELILTAPESQSHSLIAAFSLESPGGSMLTYQYQSDPRMGSPDSMQIHYGTTRLMIKGNLIEGDYYSGRGRQNTGTLSLQQ